MTVSDFADEVREYYGRYGIRGLKYNVQDLWHGLLSRLGFWLNYGEDVYDYEWDLLIVLDACRWDLMEEVIDEYDWIESAEPFMSNASHSREWLHKTFMDSPRGLEKFKAWSSILWDPDSTDVIDDYWEMSEPRASGTAYITWNQFAQILDLDKFYVYDSFGKVNWGNDQSYLDPRSITDRTIDVMRSEDPEYTIAHYMQPHTPFPESDGVEMPDSVWERIQRGEKDYDEAWREYREALRMVMDEVELLIRNVDAEKVVITADHGNAIGEFGCYGHRPYVPLPAVKRVPWITTTARDLGEYTPDIEDRSEIDEDEIEERLENLGYR